MNSVNYLFNHTTVALAFLGLWAFAIIFYALYVASITLYAHRKDVNWCVYLIGAPVLICMVLIDVFAQLTLCTIIFLDLPQEWMVTLRLRRYKLQENMNWRKKAAQFVCEKLLNPFDPTKEHC